MNSAIVVIKPKIIASTGQSFAKLYDLADVRGSDCRVGWWKSHPGTVIKPIPGATLAQVARNLDR